MADELAFAAYPSAVIYTAKDLKKPCQHLLWGDEVRVEKREGAVAKVKSRGAEGFMRTLDLTPDRLLEITFVDIGQGDGTLVTTPAGRHMLVDAGEGDNMRRFLRWRFDGLKKKVAFEAAVISHSDSDHYGGLDDVFDENVTFDTIYTNGFMERTGKEPLGARTKGPDSLCTELVRSRAELDAFLAVKARWNKKRYPTLFKKGVDKGIISKVQSLSVVDRHMPGYGPHDLIAIEVLGPVVETIGGATGLRWFDDVGPTKNGHSVVLRLIYRDVRILLGGDLNIPSENLLLGHHTGLPSPAASADEHAQLVAAARKRFEVDVAKACHHGSADVSLDFLSAVNAIATVVSSGDAEPHAHPRAEALGAIGRCSRGPRPLIFSTELARSSAETIKHPHVLRKRLLELPPLIAATADKKTKEKLEKEFGGLVNAIDRSVAVFGAINLRTDGKRVVLAYKIEAPISPARKWDIYLLVPDGQGGLRFESKHD